LLIDLEHGMGDEPRTLQALQAIEHTGAAGIVRVESHVRQPVHRILDLGPEGIMFPRLTGTEESRAAIATMRYQPAGLRGVARSIRATQYGANFSEYMEHFAENSLGIIQVENEEILGELDAVAAIDGVDVLFIGPSDLSLALGIFGRIDHPKYLDAIERTARAAQKAGKATGVLIGSPDEFPMYAKLGYQFIACGVDMGYVYKGSRAMIAELREQRDKTK
jgi:4-hydroxy-2-oxoheptanedioate aldolase